MLTGEKVVGALYVGSRRAREFPPIEVALTSSALAAQGAIAIENGRLYEALAEQNRLLEGSFAVHRALTDAALDRARAAAHICTELSRLLDTEIVLEQDISPPFAHATRRGGEAGTIRRPGRGPRPTSSVCGLDALTPLQEKALEHAATVLALELVKERAQQQVEWQLQGRPPERAAGRRHAARPLADRARPPPRRRPRSRRAGSSPCAAGRRRRRPARARAPARPAAACVHRDASLVCAARRATSCSRRATPSRSSARSRRR